MSLKYSINTSITPAINSGESAETSINQLINGINITNNITNHFSKNKEIYYSNDIPCNHVEHFSSFKGIIVHFTKKDISHELKEINRLNNNNEFQLVAIYYPRCEKIDWKNVIIMQFYFPDIRISYITVDSSGNACIRPAN